MVPVALAVVLLAGVAVGVGALGGIRHGRDVVTAVVRAVVQIVVVGSCSGWCCARPRSPPLPGPGARGGELDVRAPAAHRHPHRAAGVAGDRAGVGAGAGTAAGIVLGVGALPAHVLQVVPFTAQLIGGSMTATTLAGRRMLDDVDAGWHEVEGGWRSAPGPPRRSLRWAAPRRPGRSPRRWTRRGRWGW